MGSRASVLRTNVGIQVPSAHRVLRVESLDGDDPRDLILTPISTDLMIDVSPLERISEKADFDPIVNREIRVSLGSRPVGVPLSLCERQTKRVI